MKLELEVPTKEQCELVRKWRNEDSSGLRTPFPLTKEQQEQFYRDVICNKNSPHRYWSVVENKGALLLLGFGGITNIQWENSIGEISLIINPELREKGYGEKVVGLLLDQAFNYLNLQTVCGECYKCNPAYGFWKKLCNTYILGMTELPNRKYWNGLYYNSAYFSFDANDFRKVHSSSNG